MFFSHLAIHSFAIVQILVKLNQPLVHILGRLRGLQTSFTTKISDHHKSKTWLYADILMVKISKELTYFTLLNLLTLSTGPQNWISAWIFLMCLWLCTCGNVSKTAAHVYFISLSKYFPYLFILHSLCESGKVSKEILFFLPFIWLSQPWKSHYRSFVGKSHTS